MLIPVILAVIVGLIFTFLTVLDPLYAAKRTAEIWDSIYFFGILQFLNAFISNSFFGFAAAVLVDRIKINLIYPIIVGLSLLIHLVFLPIFAVCYYVFFQQRFFSEASLASFLMTLVVSIILCSGLFEKKKRQKK